MGVDIGVAVVEDEGGIFAGVVLFRTAFIAAAIVASASKNDCCCCTAVCDAVGAGSGG